MKGKITLNLLLALGLMLALGAGSSAAQEATASGPAGVDAALGTAFTYQGRLTQAGSPVAGPCDFQFSLWDAASSGNQAGSTLTKTNVALTNGYFDAALDFGDGGLGIATFAGDARWLAISVRCPAGSGTYTPLSDRVALNATPYALSLRPGAVVAGDKSGLTALIIRNTTTASIGTGVKAETNATQGTALFAESRSSSLAATYGVYATTASRGGTAVYGESKYSGSSLDNKAYGGYFKANAMGDVGVYGESAWAAGGGVGVIGKTNAQFGYGVQGVASHTTGETIGVYGEAASPNGYGVYSNGRARVNGALSVNGALTWKAMTSYVHVGAPAFQPAMDTTPYLNVGYGLSHRSINQCPNDAERMFLAPVNLPHGATITGLTFYGFNEYATDVSGGEHRCFTHVVRLMRSGTEFYPTEMASAAYPDGTGWYYANSAFQASAPSISQPGVDNSRYAYYLELNLPTSVANGDLIWFKNVRIEYQIVSPY